MDVASIAEAKARLSELVGRAEAGEEITLTRHGKAVARIVPIHEPKRPIDVDALRALTASQPLQEESAGEFIRRLRDESRY